MSSIAAGGQWHVVELATTSATALIVNSAVSHNTLPYVPSTGTGTDRVRTSIRKAGCECNRTDHSISVDAFATIPVRGHERRSEKRASADSPLLSGREVEYETVGRPSTHKKHRVRECITAVGDRTVFVEFEIGLYLFLTSRTAL